MSAPFYSERDRRRTPRRTSPLGDTIAAVLLIGSITGLCRWIASML